MEITVTEFVLFLWGTLATVAALHSGAQLMSAKRFIVALVENPTLYKELSDAAQRVKAAHESNQPN